MPHFVQPLIAHGMTVYSSPFILFSISFSVIDGAAVMLASSFAFSTSVRKDIFYFPFHYTPSIPILSASCVRIKKKKNRKGEEIELTGGDESKGERGDRNGGELIWRWLPAKN